MFRNIVGYSEQLLIHFSTSKQDDVTRRMILVQHFQKPPSLLAKGVTCCLDKSKGLQQRGPTLIALSKERLTLQS
jgi:hypothetical protein